MSVLSDAEELRGGIGGIVLFSYLFFFSCLLLVQRRFSGKVVR